MLTIHSATKMFDPSDSDYQVARQISIGTDYSSRDSYTVNCESPVVLEYRLESKLNWSRTNLSNPQATERLVQA